MSRYRKLTTICCAVVLSLGLAACGGGGGDGGSTIVEPDPEPDPGPDPALGAARTAAMVAADAAKAAADAAKTASDDAVTAVASVAAIGSADTASYALAQNASNRATDAYMAAKAANDAARAASDAAATANTVADAEAQRDAARARQGEAEAAKSLAETELANARMYAGMVQAARDALDGEAQRMIDVAAARTAAMQSYMDADADAAKAESAADEAEATAPGSPGAAAARAAATAARAAATAAKDAHDAIMDTMTKAEADARAAEANAKASEANDEYMTAKRENDTIQTQAATIEEQQRRREVAAATDAAEVAATAAREAATAARTAATAARNAANAARDARTRAQAARTDADAARTAYMAADAAATAAENAAAAAETAATDAEAAHTGIDAGGSTADARAAQGTAETKRSDAEGSSGSAAMQQTAAETARGEAVAAAGAHVLSLFKAANGDHVMDLASTTTVDEKAAHVASVGAAIAAAASAASGDQTGAGTVAGATWPADTPDDPATDAMDESTTGVLSVSVNPAGAGDIPFETEATRAADPTATPPVTARIQTARRIPGLGVFTHGFDIWEDDGDTATATDRARAIVFTDKRQGTPAVTEVTAVSAKSLTNAATGTTNTVTDLGTPSGTGGYTGVTFYEGADTSDEGEAFTGTLTCPANAACSAESNVAQDGTVTYTVEGFVFSGSREARAAVAAAPAAENDDYLAFGLWLDESTDGAADTFGAFAAGGTGYAVDVQSAVTGTASYSGKAAGAHHKTGEGVNWFDGDARLTADFGTDAAPGTVSGAIDNIRVNGGAALSDPIFLGQASLTDASASFDGAAFMGAATAPGAATHEFDGTWSGAFYGATADDAATDADESIAAPLAAAGTFGVTRSTTTGTGDAAMTTVESFVGAFGAHRQ